MLTQKDLDEIDKLLDEKFDEKFKFYPTKDELFSKLDTLMGEVKTMRDSQEIHAGSHSEINDRIEKLENILKAA